MIHLIGGSGEPNFGDELIVLNWIERYRDAGANDEIYVDCKSVKRSEALHAGVQGGRSPGDRHGARASLCTPPERTHFIRLLKALTVGRDGIFSDYVRLGRDYVRENWEDLVSPGAAGVDLRGCRLIHLVGGGYITGAWPNSGALFGACAELAARLDVPLVATGLGLEPFGGERMGDPAVIRKAVERFAFVECRDQGSYHALNTLLGALPHFRLGLDDAFQYPMPEPSTGPRTLHLCSFDAHVERLLAPEPRAAIQRLAARFDRTVCWVCAPSDAGFALAMRTVLPALEVWQNARLLYEPDLLGASDFFVTSRFHPHLLAARAGLAGYYLAHSNFYRSKHRGVSALGSAFRPLQSPSDLVWFESTERRLSARDAELVAQKNATAGEALSLLATR